MLIKRILSQKKSASVHTVLSIASIKDAVSDLSQHRVGALIVSDNGNDIDGILSERDIVRELGRQGAQVLAKTARNLMTAKVSTCGPEDSAENILQVMTEGRFRHMPVVDGDTLIGMVSIGDLVKARLDEISQENSAMVEMIRG